MEEELHPWEVILGKYGHKANYIEGDKDQPNYSFTFDLNYQQKDSRLRFSWNNTRNDYIEQYKFRWDTGDPRLVGHIYCGKTVLLMELPQQHNKLKIYNAGYVYNLLSLLNRHKVQTGYANFDKTFITIVKPTSVIADITPQLEYLLDPDFGRSLTLETDYEDAITLKFYLQLKLNTLLEDEKQIEKLLKHTAVLVDRLSMFPPGS